MTDAKMPLIDSIAAKGSSKKQFCIMRGDCIKCFLITWPQLTRIHTLLHFRLAKYIQSWSLNADTTFSPLKIVG